MYVEDMCSELSSQLMSDVNCRVWIDSDTIHSNGILFSPPCRWPHEWPNHIGGYIHTLKCICLSF